MNKLYYGQGECLVEGDATYVNIRYKGAVEIRDVTSRDYYITANANIISIVSIRKPVNVLNKLFSYKGELKILSATTLNYGHPVSTTIKKFMDYSELLTSNAEDLTVKSEDLKATNQYGNNIRKTKLLKKIIPNLNTDEEESPKLLLDGEDYTGSYHTHIISGVIMTGAGHTSESKELKIKRYK
tara:strand:+ start:5650 stop:6201 length:552 start_codon:yes stop_codon:yes gene_type:complete